MRKLSKDNKVDESFGTVVLEQDPQTKEPPQYQVILLNSYFLSPQQAMMLTTQL